MIADIYKSRWDIELFFKWIKQNLKIKTFFGTSKNAVMTSILIAMIYYLLLLYIKYVRDLLYFTRVIAEFIFRKVSIIEILSIGLFKLKNKPPDYLKDETLPLFSHFTSILMGH